ncbi:hypothetical protein ACFB49_42800 [Sphingomonas sp. DBB INV C78]|uniref:SANT/Myb-like DNA-binding domain-containing protein n=1 Tax=Sphingomonas sp. DBB INV C78 TaxID=3349434 RepID=UPI0036D3BA73
MEVSEAAAPAMAGSASDFVRASNIDRWTGDEDAIVIAGVRDGLTRPQIAELLGNRSAGAVKTRIHTLRMLGEIPESERSVVFFAPLPDEPAAKGSAKLLRAMLHFGLRDLRGLEGLSASRFVDLCHQHGVCSQ